MVYQEFKPVSLCETHVSSVCVGIVFIRYTSSMTVYIDASAGLHSDRFAPGEVLLVRDPPRQ